jgi:formylglycine-generating enzyme required for sulfatase activity
MKERSLTLAMLATSLAVALLPGSFGRAEDAGRAPTTLGSAAEAPQKSFKNRYGIEMVYVPSGEFMMGSEDNDTAKPVHRVRIGYGFYMSRYEITQAQWQAAVGKLPSDPEFRGHNLPVDNAEFEDVVNFINKLNKLNDGYNYRLPSEAEWEYGCRAGTTGDYYGDLDRIAWYAANSGDKTHPVGEKQPNAFGLYDMLGNVQEWCGDYWHDNYKGAPTDGSKWIKGGDRVFRGMFRGGRWNDDNVGATFREPLVMDVMRAGVRLVAVARTATSRTDAANKK